MEEYFGRSPAVKLLKELDLPLIEDVAHSTVRLEGKIYPYQGDGARDQYLAGIFNAEERAAFLKWNERAWSLYSKLHASHYEGKPLPPELAELLRISLADFVNRDKLPHKVSEWIRATVEPEMAIEWDKIAALDGIDEMRLFLDTPEGFGEKNYHVRGGNTRFTEALASRLSPDQIMTQARVTAIEQTATGVKLRVLEKERSVHRSDRADGSGHGPRQPHREDPVLASAQPREVEGYQHDEDGQLHQGALPRRSRGGLSVEPERREHPHAAVGHAGWQHLRRDGPPGGAHRRAGIRSSPCSCTPGSHGTS